MKGVLLILAVGVLVSSAEEYFTQEECEVCEPENCLLPQGCVAGVVKDKCGCCDVCAKAEYELCDHPRVISSVELGKCGEELECRLRDDLADDDAYEAICFCRHGEELCGSDNVTYDNLCGLMAASVQKGEKIKVNSKGPCKTAPFIVGPPMNTQNKTGADIALSCEAQGYPIPTVEWTWTRVDGKTFFLPSDDDHVSVNMRGGPERWQVTGWLQIMDIRKEHEGDYTCIAQNEFGVVQESARVNVISDPDHDKKHKKRTHHHQKLGKDGNKE